MSYIEFSAEKPRDMLEMKMSISPVEKKFYVSCL